MTYCEAASKPVGGRGRRRHHLGHEHIGPIAVGNPASQFLRAHKGNGVEDRVVLFVAGQVDEPGTCVVSADHDYGLGSRPADLFQPFGNILGASDVGTTGYGLQVELLERQFGADESIKSVGVVLVEDSNSFQIEIGHQMGYCGLGFLVVGGPDIDHIAVEGLAQGVGTREHPHEWDACFLHQGEHLDGGRRTHIAEQGQVRRCR